MTHHPGDTRPIASLQRSLRQTQLAHAVTMLALLGSLAWQAFRHPAVFDEVRTHRLVMLDEHGVKRVEIGQDTTPWRRSRSAGVWIFDDSGHERGGMSTFDDGSVGLGMDAPDDVGAKPRDRIGMSVDADGSATLLLTGNDTGGVVRLVSDGRGGGGVQLIQGDAKNRQIHLRTLDFDGEQRETVSMD